MCRSGVGVYSAETGAESESKISDSVHLCYAPPVGNRSRKFFWHRGAKKLGGTMVPGANFSNGTGAKQVPGANFSNGTGAKHFQTLAPVSCFEWHRCHTFTKLRCHTFTKLAPVPHLYQIGTGANFLNGTSVGANFSNGTGAKHFQTLAPVSCFEWHRCHTFTKLAPVPIF